jgi:hypothetical protein
METALSLKIVGKENPSQAGISFCTYLSCCLQSLMLQVQLGVMKKRSRIFLESAFSEALVRNESVKL